MTFLWRSQRYIWLSFHLNSVVYFIKIITNKWNLIVISLLPTSALVQPCSSCAIVQLVLQLTCFSNYPSPLSGWIQTRTLQRFCKSNSKKTHKDHTPLHLQTFTLWQIIKTPKRNVITSQDNVGAKSVNEVSPSPSDPQQSRPVPGQQTATGLRSPGWPSPWWGRSGAGRRCHVETPGSLWD